MCLAKFENGAPCDFDSDCASDECSRNVCVEANTCDELAASVE